MQQGDYSGADVKELHGNVLHSIEELQKQAGADNIDLTDLKIIDTQTKIEKELGIRRAIITITVQSKGENYDLVIEQSMRSSRGWVIAGIIYWQHTRY